MQTAQVLRFPSSNTAKIVHPRPFSTYYYTDSEPDSKGVEYAKIGRAASDVGAIVAAVRNVLLGKYRSADVYGVSGVRLYRIRSGRNCIEVLGFFKPLQVH